MWKWIGLFLKKNNLLRSFSSKLEWGTYIASIAKTAFKKIGTFIPSMKFLSMMSSRVGTTLPLEKWFPSFKSLPNGLF